MAACRQPLRARTAAPLRPPSAIRNAARPRRRPAPRPAPSIRARRALPAAGAAAPQMPLDCRRRLRL